MEKRLKTTPGIRSNLQKRRAEVNLSNLQLTQTSYLQPDRPFPLIIQPVMSGVNLISWAENNKTYIQQELAKHGAILFTGFNIDTPAKFEEFARQVSQSGELFDEYGDLPRDNPGAKVYHSTPYPQDKSILFHNESSHMYRWPMKILFYCVKVAEEDGATPILDCRETYKALDPAIIARFQEKKLMYVRNFIEGLDVSWQSFFQTSNKDRVEEYCRRNNIISEWKGKNHLTTRQICPAIVKHPVTNDMLFFNQLQLHHVSCLEPEIRASMLEMFSENDLPRNVYYGDGSPIEDSLIQEISALYERLAVRFQWHAGDVVMLDNMMAAHARDPFKGTRKILVAMADMITQPEVQS
ncbi:syrP protein [Dictyobacter alpinus]|uniref:SyrP protein n=1 Tax=Dictyobacter alpinus TaxID=2014873 RepID=A0A402BAR9_9CHLR|nr:TauD/TfdA family dioxygenase [Dictyobacter alpinus]GCE28518.1 syrP protein [Dictyobacter alpinus]